MRGSLVEVLGTQTARNCLRQSVHDAVVACSHGCHVPRAHIETVLKCLNVSRAPSTPSLGHRFTKLSFLCHDWQEVQASLDGKAVLSIAKVTTVTQPVVGLGCAPERLRKPSLLGGIEPLPVVKVSSLLPKLLQEEVPREVPCSEGDGGRHRIFVSPAIQTNLPVGDKILYARPDGCSHLPGGPHADTGSDQPRSATCPQGLQCPRTLQPTHFQSALTLSSKQPSILVHFDSESTWEWLIRLYKFLIVWNICS